MVGGTSGFGCASTGVDLVCLLLLWQLPDSRPGPNGVGGIGFLRDCKDFCVSLTWHGHLGHAASSAGSRCHKILYSPEYEWPEPPDSLAGRFLKGNALFLGLPLGVAAPICSLPLICVKEYAMAITLGSVGVALVFLAVWTTWFWSPCARAYRKWRELGDYDAWPFLRASDLDRARFKAHSKADGMK